MANLAEQVEALDAALDEFNLGDLEDIAEALESKSLKRIHKELDAQLEKLATALTELKDAIEPLEMGEDEETETDGATDG